VAEKAERELKENRFSDSLVKDLQEARVGTAQLFTAFKTPINFCGDRAIGRYRTGQGERRCWMEPSSPSGAAAARASSCLVASGLLLETG